MGKGNGQPARPERTAITSSEAPPAARQSLERLASAIPASLPGYTLGRLLGAGGQGLVHEAMQDSTGRRVAVKFLRPELLSADSVSRFVNEYRINARLSHAGIAEVLDAGAHRTEDGREIPYCVMERIEGARPITRYADEHDLDLSERIELFLRVCDAVRRLHERGVVHLDLKPSNILVNADGTPKVTDFGLARLALSMEVGLGGGTPGYESPEQLDPHDCPDQRSDVYSLGVVLHELLAGVLPIEPPARRRDDDWSDPADQERYRSQLRTERPPLASDLDPSIPRDVARLIGQTLEKTPAKRPATVRRFAEALRALRAPPAPQRREVVHHLARRWRAAAGRAALAAAVILLAVAASSTMGRRIVFEWTGLHTWYAAMIGPPPAPALDKLQHVVVLDLSDDTDVESLIASERLEGVTMQRIMTLRRLHGRLCERLVELRPAVVVFDIRFGHSPAAAAFTADLAQGIGRLRAAGIPVVVGTKRWFPSPDGAPDMAPEIWRAGADWGSIYIMLPVKPQDLLHAPLAAKRQTGETGPSLALAAFAAAHQPMADYTIEFDELGDAITLHYWRPLAGRSDRRRRLDASDRIPVAAVLRAQPDLAYGVRDTDRLAVRVPPYWSDEALAEATIDYAAVFQQDPASLRDRIGGRVALIGVTQGGRDILRFGDREMHGPHLQAMALESLFASVGPIFAGTAASYGFLTGGAGLGLAIAWAAGRLSDRAGRRRMAMRRWILISLAAAMLIALAASSHHLLGFLWSPFLPAFSLVVAAEAAAWTPGLARRPRRARPTRRPK